MKVAIVSAVWNDWKSVEKLLHEVEGALAMIPNLEPSIWLVDDGSTERPVSWNALARGGIETQVIELHGNFGHQRALAAALGYLECESEEGFDAYVLMDCDGEDRPSDLLALVEAARRNPACVISAKRIERSESPLFRAAYFSYRLLFRLCTGGWIHSGNFLFLPKSAAAALCHSSHSGNHLAAAVLRLRLKNNTIPLRRGSRYDGQSKMGLSALVLHGLSAISVFRELVFARSFLLLCALSLFSGLAAAITAFASAPLAIAFAVSFFFFLAASVMALLLSISSQSLRELRHWTPALDAATIIRSVQRVRREPYAVAESSLTN